MSACRLTGETIIDFLTGRELADSDDERIRQEMEHLLIEQKGYEPGEVQVDRAFDLYVDGEKTQGLAELVVYVRGEPFMIIKSSRGSLVTREREAVAVSRLVCGVQVPFTVVTNGQDAEIIDTKTAKVISLGLEALPSKAEALAGIQDLEQVVLPDRRREKEARIYLAFANFQCPTECG